MATGHRLTTKNSGMRGVATAINDHATAIDAIIADLDTLKIAINALDTALDTLVTKINADSGDTGGDSDYAAAGSTATVGTLTAAALDGDTID